MLFEKNKKASYWKKLLSKESNKSNAKQARKATFSNKLWTYTQTQHLVYPIIH